MARARLIKPGFFLNPELAQQKPHTRLLFVGLWSLADREGRLEDVPLKIKAQLFPYERVNIDSSLGALAAAGFIRRYQHGGARFIQIQNFTKHQTPHVKEPASTIPAPDSHSAGTSRAEAISPVPETETETETESEPKAENHPLTPSRGKPLAGSNRKRDQQRVKSEIANRPQVIDCDRQGDSCNRLTLEPSRAWCPACWSWWAEREAVAQ